MKDQVAVITGASHGIGAAVALEFGRREARLLLAARNQQGLDDAAEAARAAGATQVETAVCDVSQTDSVRGLFARCNDVFGRLDVLFNNAGVGQFMSTTLTTDDIWNETISTNLTGTFLCTREALPLFEKAGGGLIINNASIAAVRGFPNFAAYCASKAGVLGLSRSMREELRERKIRVTVVMPGATDTPFWDHVYGEWNRSLMASTDAVARQIASVVDAPPELTIEELVMMPAGGAL